MARFTNRGRPAQYAAACTLKAFEQLRFRQPLGCFALLKALPEGWKPADAAKREQASLEFFLEGNGTMPLPANLAIRT
jgi:hypothetical protein